MSKFTDWLSGAEMTTPGLAILAWLARLLLAALLLAPFALLGLAGGP